jgi:SPP1 family predicted phage head-tail adaptor
MIDFGKYDQRVTFQIYDEVSDGFSGTVPTFTDVLTTFASVKQLKSSSDVEQARLDLDKTYLIKIQARASFEPTLQHRIVYKGDILTIKSVSVENERLTREYWINAIK